MLPDPSVCIIHHIRHLFHILLVMYRERAAGMSPGWFVEEEGEERDDGGDNADGGGSGQGGQGNQGE
jgi:hypothetical protein